jgi:hypothetical protein
MNEKEFKLQKGVKFWNIVASIFFALVCLFMYGVFVANKPANFSVSVFDVLILSLASFRLIRLFIYDNITLCLRDLFTDVVHEDGKYFYRESKNSFKVTLHKLMNCPWCFGIWCSFIGSFLYFTFPPLQIIFVVFAISGIASFVMLLTNLIGWHAEGKKKQTQMS